MSSATFVGQPVILGTDDAAEAYKDVVGRLLGNTDLPMRFIEPEAEKGFFARIFGQ